MDPQDVSRVQKLCKFASSSLDYDDIDAAIKNLTEALDLLHKSKQNWWKKFYERRFNQFQLVQCNVLELLNSCNNSIKV